MKHENNLGIIGSKVYLKALEDKDLEAIFEWKNNPELAKLIKAYPLPVAMYEIEEWFKKNQSDKNQIIWGIYDLKSKGIIGIVRLMFIDWISSVTELGIFIGDKTYRGKGIGKEVIQLVLDFAFKNINLHRVYLRVAESNIEAINLYKSCGFIEEGSLRNHFWSTNRYENVVIMGVLRDEHVK